MTTATQMLNKKNLNESKTEGNKSCEKFSIHKPQTCYTKFIMGHKVGFNL